MKRRAQIQLDWEDHEALKRWASEHGISISAAVRWLIRENLVKSAPFDDRLALAFAEAAGAVRDSEGEGDISERHDEILYGDDS